MSDYDKHNENGHEVISILDGLPEDEQMKLNAERYRAKPKIEDIFSHADKRVRLKNESPLELDAPEGGSADEQTDAGQASLPTDGDG